LTGVVGALVGGLGDCVTSNEGLGVLLAVCAEHELSSHSRFGTYPIVGESGAILGSPFRAKVMASGGGVCKTAPLIGRLNSRSVSTIGGTGGISSDSLSSRRGLNFSLCSICSTNFDVFRRSGGGRFVAFSSFGSDSSAGFAVLLSEMLDGAVSTIMGDRGGVGNLFGSRTASCATLLSVTFEGAVSTTIGDRGGVDSLFGGKTASWLASNHCTRLGLLGGNIGNLSDRMDGSVRGEDITAGGSGRGDSFGMSLEGGRGAARGISNMPCAFIAGRSGTGDVMCCGPFLPKDAASLSISGLEYGEAGGVLLTSELARLFKPCKLSARLSASPFRGDGGEF
jgi:hypothetical protein